MDYLKVIILKINYKQYFYIQLEFLLFYIEFYIVYNKIILEKFFILAKEWRYYK
jgi:hypothetical protein